MLDLSIGIMAYNEERGVGRLITALLKQQLVHATIREIIVVASGCTDKTEAVVQTFQKTDSRIGLIIQSQRKGKASAINLFLAAATEDIVVLESADTVPEAGGIDKLVAPLAVPNVGMTGARPVPVNTPDTFMGYSAHLMWSLHHLIALRSPKLGELIAFRNIIPKIPEDTTVDEASIEALITQAGYKLYYVPDAVVRNKGPDSIKDFLRQRRRISAGHQYLVTKQGYRVSTLSPKTTLRVLLQRRSWNVRDILWTAGVIILEVTARALGSFDVYVNKKVPFVWDISASTKKWIK